ncbi:MAG: response regulator [Chitinophagaceae bacterium]|jgi:CheY-like chemotaxis protein|nr:response regulator [Chitinophagaceae bacterium]
MTKICQVLITEDDQEDAAFMKEALMNNSFGGDISVFSNGLTLLEQLTRMKAHGRLPELVILDLNMPFKTGLEVLSEMKQDPSYRAIPVVVLTASLRQQDEDHCAALGCERFLRKPVRMTEYTQIATDILNLLRQRSPYC